MSTQKYAFTIKELTHVLSLGRTSIYKEIKEGRLEIVKVGRRTLVTLLAINSWVANRKVMGGSNV